MSLFIILFEFIFILIAFNLAYLSRFCNAIKSINQFVWRLCSFLSSSVIFFCKKYSKISNFIAHVIYLFFVFNFCKFKFNFIFTCVFFNVESNSFLGVIKSTSSVSFVSPRYVSEPYIKRF